MSRTTIATRVEALETKASSKQASRRGGVLIVPAADTAAEWDAAVAAALATAPPGDYLVTPGMAEDEVAWERRARATQERLRRGVYD